MFGNPIDLVGFLYLAHYRGQGEGVREGLENNMTAFADPHRFRTFTLNRDLLKFEHF